VTTLPTRDAACIDLETLAVFVEGRLEGASREEVVRHLAECDACREIVAESRALATGLETEASGNTVPIAGTISPSRLRRRSTAVAAAAAALAGVALSWWFGSWRSEEPRALEELAASSRIAALPTDWADPAWPVMRDAEPGVPDATASFRIGVRSVDLQIAAAANDRNRAARLAVDLAHQLRHLPFSDPVVNAAELYARQVEAEHPKERDTSTTAEEIVSLCRDFADPEMFELGRWSELGRLLAMSGSTLRWKNPPSVPSENSRLAEAIVDAARAEPHERRAAFTRLLVIGGDSRALE
jgi:hypothetical protein